LKRTRRVEVVRYSRRSTVIYDEAVLESDLAAEQAVVDTLLGLPPVIESPGQETSAAEQQVTGAHAPGVVHRRRPLGFLKRLIRG
jgi:hypothetical protein